MSRFITSGLCTALACFVVLTVLRSAHAQAGEDTASTSRIVEILNADSARSTQVDGQPADMLIGNVALKQGDTFLNAERAVRFKQSDLIIFEGSVTIVDEGDSLTADKVEYESDVKMGVGTGNVRWSDGEVEITAAQARYFVDDKIAEFERDVVMQDSTTTVLSLYGLYEVERRVAAFHDDVYLEQKRLALTSNELVHERESGLTTAIGAVWIYRMPELEPDVESARLVLVADSASSERDSGMNRLNGSAGLVRIDDASTDPDTLIVRSSSVVVEFSDSTDVFDAKENVRFWSGRLAGRADSLRYSGESDDEDETSSIRMFGSPLVWSDDTQVNGDTVDVQVEDGELRGLQAYRNAFVGFRDSTYEFIHQLKGRRLEAHFRADTLRRLVMSHNAEAIYFAVDSDDEDDRSALQFTSRHITLRFDNGEIGRIVASDDVEGDLTELSPGMPLPSLKDFNWRISERPTREELLDENLRAALKRFEPF